VRHDLGAIVPSAASNGGIELTGEWGTLGDSSQGGV